MNGLLAYVLGKKYTDSKVADLPEPFKVKPAVQTYADLPATGNQSGDVRKVISEDGKEYYWDGTAWEAFGPNTQKENLFRFATMPTAGADNVGQIVQYIGTTTADYTNGYFYECVESGGTYSWAQKNVQESGALADALRYSAQTLTEAQKIQALKNLDGVRIVPLTDGTETLAQIAARLTTINTAGEHVFFDVASLSYPLYLCTIAISYTGQTPTAYKLNDLVTGSISQGSYDGTKTLNTILSEAVQGFHTITITCTATDGVTVTGQTIKVEEAGSGQEYASFTYNGQPVTVVVPDGFAYSIIPICTLAQHYYNDGPVVGIASQDRAASFSFKSLGAVQTIEDLKSVADLGLGQYITIGKQVTTTHSTLGTLTFDVVDYDDNTETLTLLMHDCLAAKQFDAPEASYYAENGLSAGAYKFKQGSTTYYFTIATAVPAGGQVMFNATEFKTWAAVGDVNTLETGSTSSTEISGATDLGTMGVGLLNHADRVSAGSNNYYESALRQWLEADEAAGSWWEPMTHFDRPPAYASQIPGFLAGLSQTTLDAIDTTAVKCHSTATYKAPDSTIDKDANYTVNAKFFLASEMEIYGTAIYSDGSTQYDAYVGTDNSAKIKRIGASALSWWLRSPYSDASFERLVYTSGAVNYYVAYRSFAVAPACKISNSNI